VESSKVTPGAKLPASGNAESLHRDSPTVPGDGTPESATVPSQRTGARKLIAYQQYFGLEARAFQAGARRMLARASAQTQEQPWVNTRSIADDFHLDRTASGTLLRAFLAGGLLYPDGNGGYFTSDLFREYALAEVVVPLSRTQARELINTACAVAARINAEWHRNPFLIDVLAVSGSYLTRSDAVAELSLWPVLSPRTQPRTPLLTNDEALRDIKAKIGAVSSYIVVRLALDKKKVPRPFSVVFQAGEELIEPPPRAWDRLRGWSASIGRGTGARQVDTPPQSDARVQPAKLEHSSDSAQRPQSAWGDVTKRG
jgi:hypothetical protein